MGVRVIHGDCRDVLPKLAEKSVQCVVTSPPYFGLRDYGTGIWSGGDPKCEHKNAAFGKGRGKGKFYDGGKPGWLDAAGRPSVGPICPKCGAVREEDKQIGLEETPEKFVAELVRVFREVRRVLRDDGTLWVVLGDSYNAYNGNRGPSTSLSSAVNDEIPSLPSGHGLTVKDLKPKDLIGIPWRVAFALQADGWYLRSAIIWNKPNPMPESVEDRPTCSYDTVFLLTKSDRYFYDGEAIKEEAVTPAGTKGAKGSAERFAEPGVNSRPPEYAVYDGTRNARNVWTIPTNPFPEAHFATFPPALAERCILAGTRPDDVVLDPFGGSGTVGLVARNLERNAILIELKPKYVEMSRRRSLGPLFAELAK